MSGSTNTVHLLESPTTLAVSYNSDISALKISPEGNRFAYGDSIGHIFVVPVYRDVIARPQQTPGPCDCSLTGEILVICWQKDTKSSIHPGGIAGGLAGADAYGWIAIASVSETVFLLVLFPAHLNMYFLVLSALWKELDQI